MLPSLGLFKSIPCPLYPDCKRNPCFYSHTTRKNSSIKGILLFIYRKPIDLKKKTDRPVETVKRQKINHVTTPMPSRPTQMIPSLIPKKNSTIQPKALPPKVPQPKVPQPKVLQPKVVPQETKNRPMSALEAARKRVAHTPIVKPSQIKSIFYLLIIFRLH
ncbi:uncharacterized protein B0P05DRAFT_24922 [Gilbertella persicaria]|uniref:uncharacterized protein n=1 Tax=Gilbertella persicaria TaxID=101096 RepID=UPI00221EFE69|nr:uncharacterized protein B0P05DRAFT_24922 [Gilbertella persicaria]KAI8085846.1 hypothetical protein B0P05DRAFT_24922 [Gilbertella persicaria]